MRPNSTPAEVSPGAGYETAQQKASTLQQSAGDRSAPPAARSRIGRHLAPPWRKCRAASALGSPSHASPSSSPSASDMQSTSSRTCSSSSDREARGAYRSLQRDSQRNRGRGATPATAAHPSASSAITKGSKTSWRASQQQRKQRRVAAGGAYSSTSSISSASATSPNDTAIKSARTPSDSWLSRRKCASRDDEGDAFLSPSSSTSVEPICAFTDVLPRDVYLHICGFLTEADCCTLLEVSLCMHAAITSADSIVWRHMCVSTWLYKQGFQTFIQHVRALEVLARQEELEVQALQQHMLLLREQGIVFGESDVSATCDCTTVLIRRRQHERARWMAAAAAGATTSKLHRSRLTSKVGSAAASASSTTQTGSSCVISGAGGRPRCKSRRCHRNTKRSTTTTASTSRRSGNICGAAGKRPTHAVRWAEPSTQRPNSRSTATTATSRTIRSRRKCSDGSRDSDDTSESLSRSCSSRTLSSSESSKEETCNGMHHIQTHPPSHHSADGSAAPLRPGGSDAGEKASSATGCPPPSPPPSSSHADASAEPREKERGGSSAALRSTSSSDDRGHNAYEYLSTEDGKTEDRRERRVCIRLPEAEAEDEGNANLTDASVLAVRSRSGSRHRRRSRRSLSRSLLHPAHGYPHHHRHDGSSRQQQQQPGSRHRRSHREKRRKPARQRRRKRGRSRGPRSTGGGGSRHRSQPHRGQGRQHRSSHQHHHNPKATKSSRRRRRRQRNAAAAAAAAAQADRDGGSGSFYASSPNAAVGGGISTYFYQTATYEAIKSTSPVHAAQHVAPSMVPFRLGGRQASSVSGPEAVVIQSRGKVQRNPRQLCGSEVHACEASAAGALAQPAAPLNSGSDVAQRTISAPPKTGSVSQQITSPQTVATAPIAATAFGTGANEERLYWWQLTPEARQHQLRRMQQLVLQQQFAASSGELTTRTSPSLRDGDELADEAALREWDELEASSLGSSSGTMYEEDADASREGDREEGYSDRNGASVSSDDTERRSECSTNEDEDEGEGSTDSSDYRRRRHRSRKLWRTQSRSTRRSVTSDETTSTTALCRLSYRQRHGGEPSTSSFSSCSSRLHTAPPSLTNGESTASECGVDNEKERWMHAGVRGAASLPHQRCKLSDGAGGGTSEGTADRYDSDEGATAASSATASVVSQADNKLIAGSSSKSGSGKRVLPRGRRSGHPYTSPDISVAALVPSSSRLAIRAERRVAKALEKRYEGIEEAMVITRSKSMLIHTLERQTHAHLPRLLAAAQRQHRLMMNARPAATAAHHADPSLVSPTVALHRGTPDFSEVASEPTARAIILIGAGSSGFSGCGTSTTLPAAASLAAPPASHLLSSLDNSFATVAASTLAVPASPLYQLARTSSSNALTSSSGERGGGLSGTLSCQDSPRSSPPSTSTASLAADTTGNGGGVAAAPRAPLQGVLERHRMAATAAAAVGDNGVRGGAPSSAGGAPLQPTNDDEAVDDDDEEEQFAPVSWKFAFFMSRREAQRVKITLQDLIEGMWVVCFRSSGRTHPIRFVGQHQVFLYPPLPTTEEEEAQRLQQNGLESSEAEGEAGHTTTTAAATSATSAAPPLPFHILQGGAQLVVHQFPPMKVMRRNGAAPGNAAAAGGTPAAVAPVSSANAPAAAAVTPAMMAERRFAAEPQATLRKLRLRMLSSAARDAATFETMPYGDVTGGLAAAGCAVDDEHNGGSGRDLGCRDCTSYDLHDTAAVSSTATTNDVRRAIAQGLGFCAAYMKEALGQLPFRSGEEHTNEDEGATTRRGCSAAPSRAKRRRFFYGPLTQREYEARQRRELCFAPGGAGDVLNDWGWTITSQYVKIFSLDITAPLYVKRLQRVADVEVIGRNHGGGAAQVIRSEERLSPLGCG
ncbi:conserved hypothetical protein [Leishmania major strain Friedlin]|uniref:F-box domain-containing protein n=1 Tax=Leishmania major TaxID=5664 RepID=E9AER6_LEIMA|nr:conserved hypothetical protein [Leishmania major strain Friedlin]CAG9582442.1 hypothetical_protein_-_conserved [Leishmania major strain Friedlin]CBZ12719.1 conserved hypothetical protein [Leishmania major strain Friedlin]|eukprot:XP_003722486.1 conserved hypothetical protein [Leishmania major strain Friedlin]